jgi:putative aldouronate transport system permease protein
MVLPALLYTLVFGYLTLPYLISAFQKFDYRTGIFDSVWVGLKNFEFFFKSKNAVIVTRNTIRLNVLFITFVTIASVALAVYLNELKNRKFSKFFQSTYLFMRIWKTAGMQAVIFLAAIVGIDKQLYEAAVIDGAGRWKQITSITLPLIAPTVAIVTLLAIGRIMYADFGMIYAIIGDNGILYPTADVIDTYLFRTLRLLGNPAQAMAVGLYQAAVGFVLVYGSNWLVRKTFKEGALF